MAEFFDSDKVIGTGKEVILLGAGAIAGSRFLDRDEFFKEKIAADPNFTQGFLYQRWGAIVALGAAWGSTKVENKYLKVGLVGLAIYGALVEARQDFGMGDSGPRWGMMGPITDRYSSGVGATAEDLDAQLKAAAEAMNGPMPLGAMPIAMRVTEQYNSGVGMGQRIPMGW
jgi:hypothetical protein